LPFWGLLLPFWETPESFDKTFFRHLGGVYLNEVPTKSKEICPGVEGQEGQHFTDGSDGPSNPDPAPTELQIEHFELYIE